MKLSGYLFTLGLLLPAAGIMHGATITFASQGTPSDPNEWNSLGASITITRNPAWAPALPGSDWVSYFNTGDPASSLFMSPPNGTVVSFFELLTLPWEASSASITYRADDSAAFYINNVLVRPEAPVAGNTYTRCSDVPVGCTVNTEVTMDITPFLSSGANTLRFDVAQRNGSSFGLNYLGSVAGPGPAIENPVPEPATFGLIGMSLLAIGLWRRGPLKG